MQEALCEKEQWREVQDLRHLLIIINRWLQFVTYFRNFNGHDIGAIFWDLVLHEQAYNMEKIGTENEEVKSPTHPFEIKFIRQKLI